MSESTTVQLRFPSIPGHTIRGEFDGGTMSSDFGPILLRGIDQQIGLTQRLSEAFDDKRHPSYIDHPLRDLFAQRIFQIASGYEDGNDANNLRNDPMFQIGLNRVPQNEKSALASSSTFSRLENAATRKDVYGIAKAFVDNFVVSYAKPPKRIVLDMDHSEDQTYGQQELSLFNGYYESNCYLPLFIFEGLSGKLITAVLRPGKRPTGEENAMILKRILKTLRTAWPETHIILRGDSHFSNPELMQLVLDDPKSDFIFGVGNNVALYRLAAPYIEQDRKSHQLRCNNAIIAHNALRDKEKPAKPLLPSSTEFYHEVEYAAETWPQQFRVVIKAEVSTDSTHLRCVVTTFKQPDPQIVYEAMYSARGQDENFIKMIKNDLHSDRTSDHTFLANQMRLFFSCGAYVLLHSLRTETLANTEFANAQPITIILRLFKIAVRVIQYKDRIKLQLPSSCPVKHILHRMSEILFQVQRPIQNTG